MTQHNHSTVRRSAKVLAAIAAFSIAIVTVFSFAACQKQPASADGTPAPQSPAAEASPAAVPTAPPATAVPVFSGYTNACQPVKVTFPSAGSASAFSVNFVLPEGWTVKAEADGASASLSDFCAGMDMRKLILDENGNCVGAVCAAEYDKQAYESDGVAGVYAAATLMNHAFSPLPIITPSAKLPLISKAAGPPPIMNALPTTGRSERASMRSKIPPQPHSRRTTPCSLSLSFPTVLTTPQGLPLILRKISGLSKNFEGFTSEEDIKFDYHFFNAQRVARFMLPMNID